jgi:hypothetical protein
MPEFELRRDIQGVPVAGYDEVLDLLKVSVQNQTEIQAALMGFLNGIRKDSSGRLAVNAESVASSYVYQNPGNVAYPWAVSPYPGLVQGQLDYARSQSMVEYEVNVRQYLVFT